MRSFILQAMKVEKTYKVVFCSQFWKFSNENENEGY